MGEHRAAAEWLTRLLDEVWNRRMVGRIHDGVVSNARLTLAAGEERYGRDELVAHVIGWLAPFPDLTLEIEETIAGPDEGGGTLVAMRQRLRGTNRRASRYGPATDQEIDVTRLVTTRVHAPRAVEWWIAEDERSLLAQLGLDETAALVRYDTDWPAPTTGPFGATPRPIGQGSPPPLFPHDDGALPGPLDPIRQLEHDLFNRRLVGRARELIAEGCRGRWASGREIPGPAGLESEILTLHAALPDLWFRGEPVIGAWDAANGLSVASHWTICGTHAGAGMFGPPTGRRVTLGGIAHYHLADGRIDRLAVEINEARVAAMLRDAPLG